MSIKSNVRIYGNILEKEIRNVKKRLLELYKSLGEAPKYVEISFFENESLIREVNTRESKTIKQVLSIEPTLFSSTHPVSSHAWFNYPSIGINMSLFMSLPQDIKVAWLERVAADTILHNTLESYNIQKPPLLSRLSSFDFLDKQIIRIGFKLFLSSIFEYEISKYLVHKQLLDNQIKFFLYYLEVTPGERKGVKANERILDIQFLTLLSRFVYLFGAMPIYTKTLEKRILAKIKSNLSLFPDYVYNDIWQLLKVYLPMLTFDTQKNVDFLLPRIVWIVRKIDRYIR